MDAIDQAASLALPLFRLYQWTWRDETTPPTLIDLRATFSSLAWELRRDFGFQGDGRTHFAAAGRLLVVMEANGTMRYSVNVMTEF
jgi:hypothetical protein